MSDDLHTRLHTAITTRLNLAKAAAGFGLAGNSVWTYQDGLSEPTVLVGEDSEEVWTRAIQAEIWRCEDELDGCPEVARGLRAEGKHIALNDPAFVIRACERDLRVLERHPSRRMLCCGVLHPCPEITDLATVYLENTRTQT